MVCRKEIRIESIQQIIENKNLNIFITKNFVGHKTLIRVYSRLFEKSFLLITNLIGLSSARFKN